MRKYFYIIFIFSLLLIILISNSVNAITPVNTKLGDLNKDGRVSAEEARIILRASGRQQEINYFARSIADMDRDYKITSRDARLALKASARQYNPNVISPVTIRRQGFWFSCEDLHKFIENNGYYYDCMNPSSIKSIGTRNTKSVCCASYVAKAIYDLGGDYVTAMTNMGNRKGEEGTSFRGCECLWKRLRDYPNLFEKVGFAQKGTKDFNNLLENLQRGDIVFFCSVTNERDLSDHLEHVQVIADKVGNNYYWFNAGDTIYIQNDYTKCVSDLRNTGYSAILVYRLK